MSYSSLRKLGIAAAAARAGVPMATDATVVTGAVSNAAVGDASWFHTPSIRKARIDEVDSRITQFGRELALADNVRAASGAPQLLTQWGQFVKNWEDWIENLSAGALFLPATEEWVDRQEEQLERFRTAFAQQPGVKFTTEAGLPPVGPVSPPDPSKSGSSWGWFALGALALVGATLYFARPVVVKQASSAPFDWGKLKGKTA
jgi:hypothetical protein